MCPINDDSSNKQSTAREIELMTRRSKNPITFKQNDIAALSQIRDTDSRNPKEKMIQIDPTTMTL
uniref:Uncharacterized protein n=1 Tax=Strongyloides papillosus TaxID=174720 RepID=A0A0N5C052_STREA